MSHSTCILFQILLPLFKTASCLFGREVQRASTYGQQPIGSRLEVRILKSSPLRVSTALTGTLLPCFLPRRTDGRVQSPAHPPWSPVQVVWPLQCIPAPGLFQNWLQSLLGRGWAEVPQIMSQPTNAHLYLPPLNAITLDLHKTLMFYHVFIYLCVGTRAMQILLSNKSTSLGCWSFFVFIYFKKTTIT